MDCSTPCFPVLNYLPEFAQTHVHWIGDAIQPYHPLLFPSPLALNLSQHWGLFQWVSSSYKVAKVSELQLQHQSPSNEYSGLISFRIDWFDLLAVQGILKSLLQHHSLKASILWRSVLFVVQLSYLYMTTGKTIALTVWAFVRKVMSLRFNNLSRLVIAFLPRSKVTQPTTQQRKGIKSISGVNISNQILLSLSLKFKIYKSQNSYFPIFNFSHSLTERSWCLHGADLPWDWRKTSEFKLVQSQDSLETNIWRSWELMESQSHQTGQTSHYTSPWRVIPNDMTFLIPVLSTVKRKGLGEKTDSEKRRENNQKSKFFHIHFIVPKFYFQFIS